MPAVVIIGFLVLAKLVTFHENSKSIGRIAILSHVHDRSKLRGGLAVRIEGIDSLFLFRAQPDSDLERTGTAMYNWVEFGDSIFKRSNSDTIQFIRNGVRHSWKIDTSY